MQHPSCDSSFPYFEDTSDRKASGKSCVPCHAVSAEGSMLHPWHGQRAAYAPCNLRRTGPHWRRGWGLIWTRRQCRMWGSTGSGCASGAAKPEGPSSRRARARRQRQPQVNNGFSGQLLATCLHSTTAVL